MTEGDAPECSKTREISRAVRGGMGVEERESTRRTSSPDVTSWSGGVTVTESFRCSTKPHAVTAIVARHRRASKADTREADTMSALPWMGPSRR
jgi:hypothetical protein